MNINLNDAVNDLLFLSKRLKGISELADLFSTAESLLNHVDEKKRELERLTKEVDGVKNLLAQVKAEMQEARESADFYVSDMRTLGEKIISDAKAAAKREVESVQKEYATKYTEAQVMYEELLLKVEEKRGELSVLVSDTEKANALLESIKDQIEALKKRITE